ncbi:MAG: GntR family transcriptional regulator [Chloroflexi bacterium]|nr:GntR family transcriptional regulator [Chloroflexota bacterium]
MKNNHNALSLRDRRPLYTQTIDALSEMIVSGKLKTGCQLPPEEELASQLGISRSTLREALGHMETRGYIARRQGIGTFVTTPTAQGFFGGLQRLEPFYKIAEAAGVKHALECKEVSTIVASPAIAALLNTEEGTQLVRVQTIESIDETRCMYFDDYFIYQDGLNEKLDQETQSVLIYMFDQCDPPLSHTRSEIFAIEANQDIAEKLDIKEGKPVFHMEETYFAADGGIIGAGFIYFVTDRFRFYLSRRAVRDIAG